MTLYCGCLQPCACGADSWSCTDPLASIVCTKRMILTRVEPRVMNMLNKCCRPVPEKVWRRVPNESTPNSPHNPTPSNLT
eukprot:1155956-Pelagomonas_calceolata.AAC.5